MDGRSAPEVLVLGDDTAGAATAVALDRAIGVLLGGGTVVLPTDTVYGLAALPSLPGVTDQLFELKGRAGTQPFGRYRGSPTSCSS